MKKSRREPVFLCLPARRSTFALAGKIRIERCLVESGSGFPGNALGVVACP
jgi:hypothetical protein